MFILVHRNLRFSLFKTTSVHRLFPRSSSSSPAASDNSFTVSYLINSCGFPPHKAISASRYLKFKTADRADSVIAFFKHHGFTKTQIAHLVQKFPRALTYHPQRNLLPKFDFLSCRGLSGSDILKLFTARPVLLGRSLKNYIEPNYNSIRDLLQSKDKTLIPRSACSSSSADNSFRVSYLIVSCGFSPEKAISASKSLKFKTPDRPDSVIAFFKNRGLTETQISNLVRKSPKALTYHPEKNLLPKFDFLSSTGLSDSDIIKLFTARPRFLGSSLKNRIEPNYNILRNLLQSKDRTLIAIRRCAWVLDGYFQALMISNMQILRDVGVPASKMLYLLTNQPSVLLVTTYKFKKTVEEVVEMGFDPLKSSFMSAVHAIRSMSKSTWEKKMKTYEKWGWSKPHILVAFRSNPRCMRTSEEKIDKVMDYLVNKMGFETSIIAKNSYILTVSMEKRIIPRCLVYQYCLDNGLLNDKNYCGYGWWLACSEDIFIKRLKRYEKEAPCVLKFYQEKLDLAK